MSRAQRLTFLAIAVVIAIVAAILLSSGSTSEEQDEPPANATATATPTATPGADATATPTETATPTPTPKPQPPLLQPGKTAKLRFKQGETVRFRVRSDAPEEIHVHVYDVTKDVEPGKTATVSFPADVTGIFEIEFHGTGELIGQLRVDPN